jgi:serine protease Do
MDHMNHRTIANQTPRSLIAALILTLFVTMGLFMPIGPAGAAQQVQLIDLSDSLQTVAAEVLPTVVEIVVTGYAPIDGSTRELLATRESGGSGVIVDPTGYIVTNAHVVEGARRVQVRLPAILTGAGSEGSILKPSGELVGAMVLGIDPETDLAVLKVQREGLPFLELADSDEAAPGMIVLAFGSPFGLESSVTLGILSATARQLRPEDPMIYLQTDAPINPGNSGGPLVNTRGQVVGINTMIFSQSGGNECIGFAAPSNIVRFVYEQIRENRHVQRGILGVNAQTISPLMAKALNLPRDWGVIVSDVYPGAPAAMAGVHHGDIIVSLDGKPMENARQFRVNLYRKEIGSTVAVEVLRDGRTQTLQVQVVERPDEANQFAAMVTPENNLVAKIGLLCLNLDENIARMLPNLRINSGVIVGARDSGSRQAAGFLPGDVIHTVNGKTVMTLADLKREIQALLPLSPVVVQVERRGIFTLIVFEIE